MKHLKVRQKYSAARRIFNSLLGVSSGDETLRLMFDILHENHEGTFWWVREFGDLFWAQFWAGLFHQKYMTNKPMEYEKKDKVR